MAAIFKIVHIGNYVLTDHVRVNKLILTQGRSLNEMIYFNKGPEGLLTFNSVGYIVKICLIQPPNLSK